MDLQQLLEQTLPVVNEAASFIRQEFGKVTADKVEVKARNSLVSYVDKQAEAILVDKLGQILPEATFFTEEDTVSNDRSDLVWIIDPLDGTTNFLQGIPFFSVSVALEHKGEMVLGVVHAVMQDEVFHALKGHGAYLNDTTLSTHAPNSLEDSILATGFPYGARSDAYLHVFTDLLREVQAVRRLGSAALDLAYVAAGRFDAYYEINLNAWDIAAGALLVQEAGGRVEGFYEIDGWKEGKTILAADPAIFEDIHTIIQRHRP